MNYIAAIVAAVLVLLAPTSSFAQDYLAEVVQSLQSAPVYVASGTEGTDKDTASKLQARLTSNDQITLVMLPAAAESRLGGDLPSFAMRLSESLGNQRIIGLAVGRKVVGYAPSLPAGVAADQMRRANSVSNDSVTALSTFAQNIQQWQKANPPPQPSLPAIPVPEQKGWSWLWIPGLGLTGGLLYWSWRRRKRVQALEQRTRFNTPNPIRDQLTRIAREREQVKDRELNQTLYQMCLDLEKYFQSSSRNREWDTTFFKDRLNEVISVLSKYVEVQDNPRYYYEPEKELRKGKESILDFSQYVLDSVRRGNAEDLVDYTVNTQILLAQRYR